MEKETPESSEQMSATDDTTASNIGGGTATKRRSRREIKPPRRLEEETAYEDLDFSKKKKKKNQSKKRKSNESGSMDVDGDDSGNGITSTCSGASSTRSHKKNKKGADNEKASSNDNGHGKSTNNGSRRNSNSKKFNVRKTKQGNTYIIKPKQIHTTNIDISEYEEEGVEISNATLPQITKSVKRPPQFKPSKALQNQFIQIPSHTSRARIYLECARAIAQKEARALPSHGARPWQCFVTIWDRQGSKATASSYNVKDDIHGKFECRKSGGTTSSSSKGGKKGGMATSPLFVWNKTRLELAVLPHLLDVVDVIDTNHGLLRSVQEDINTMEEYENGNHDGTSKRKKKNMTRDEEEQMYIEELIERPFTELSTVAFSDPSFVIPTIERKWISPNLVSFKSRNSAIEHSLMLLDRDKLVDKVMHGIGARGALLRAVKPTRKLALDAGYWRFERDGLWVIGQEEDWIEERLNALNALEEAKERKEEKVEKELLQMQVEGEVEVEVEVEEEKDENDIVDNLDDERDVDTDSKENKSDVTNQEQLETKNDSSKTMVEEEEKETKVALVENDVIEKPQCQETSIDTDQQETRQQQSSAENNREKEEISLKLASTQTSPDTIMEEVGNTNSIISPNEISDDSVTEQPDQIESNCNLANGVGESPTADGSPTKESVVYDVQKVSDIGFTCSSNDSEEIVTDKKPKKKRKRYNITPSTHWRLTQEQVDLCYKAIMNHYEKVMYTVKARALHSELADGFDVFRERGRGRFDMQLDDFDKPEFSFLTDLTSAAWMPVVKKILGDDATMVHKGAFLSMPGSSTQVYHQDGVHLNKKFQKPCHAINVFIPLVELTEKNGPTEFCIGTHFLGYDAYTKEMVDTPLAPAGTPIIFDYRLGHRGLGNSSREPRPIVYLTYTKSSKEFKDSVNFSSKKWRKLGEIVEKPMSRQERALKRNRDED